MKSALFLNVLNEKGSVTVKNDNITSQIVQILVNEGFVHTASSKKETVVTVDKQLVHVEALEEDISVRKNEVVQLAKKLLPSITGHLILTTNDGVISHHVAMQKKIGGIVVALVY